MCRGAAHSLQLQLARPCETPFLRTCKPWLLSKRHYLLPASQGRVMLWGCVLAGHHQWHVLLLSRCMCMCWLGYSIVCGSNAQWQQEASRNGSSLPSHNTFLILYSKAKPDLILDVAP